MARTILSVKFSLFYCLLTMIIVAGVRDRRTIPFDLGDEAKEELEFLKKQLPKENLASVKNFGHKSSKTKSERSVSFLSDQNNAKDSINTATAAPSKLKDCTGFWEKLMGLKCKGSSAASTGRMEL